jgi:hypothetical protein
MRVAVLLAGLLLAPLLSAQDGWRLEQSAAAWTPRTDHTVTAFNGKLWLINGVLGASSGRARDIWSSTDGVIWTEEVNTVPWFERSHHCTVVFNNRLWVLGGINSSSATGYDPAFPQYRHDVWSSPDGVNWTLETIAPWTGRSSFAAVVYSGRIWVMGGFSQISAVKYSLNDVWSSPDGVNWTQEVAAAAWSHRMTHRAVVFDNKMWVMGGGGLAAGFLLSDVWSSVDGVNWVQETPSASWAGRTYPTLQTYRGRMWVACGYDDVQHNYFNDAWSSSDGINWTREAPNGSLPARSGHASAVFKNRLWVFGGASPVARYNDVWSHGLYIHTTAASEWTIDKPYTATFEAREGDGPYVWSVVSGSLPTGLTLGSSTTDTITLSGTPTELGTWTFIVRVEDQATNDWAEKTLTLQINPPPPPKPPGVNPSSGTGCAANPAPATGASTTRKAAWLALFGLMAATTATIRWKPPPTTKNK